MKKFIKKIIVSVALLCAFSIPFSAFASITLVQTVSGTGSSYVNSYSLSITPTAGDTLIMAFTAGALDDGYTITDNKNNNWVKHESVINAGQRLTAIWSEQNVTSGATTITVTFIAGQFNDSAMIIREYSGLTTSSFDIGGTGSDGVNFLQSHTSSTTPTTTQANELVIGAGGCGNTDTPVSVAGAGFGNGLEQKGFDRFTFDFMEDKQISSIGTQVATWSTTSFCSGETAIATFKAVVSVIPTAVFQIQGQLTIRGGSLTIR